MNAREIANAVVDTNQQRTATQCRFNGDDQIESIDNHRLIS